MAAVRVKVRLQSTESPYYYTTTINPRTQEEKLLIKKYDSILRRHVMFKQEKIKK